MLERIVLVAAGIFTFGTCFSQIVCDPIQPVDAVSELLAGQIEASNITFTGYQSQLGFMTGGDGTIFSIGTGIVLSTDQAENIEPGGNPNDPIFGGVSGDPDLLDIANSVPPLIGQSFSVSSVNDICALEFDFIPQGDSVFFNFSFGSDEYLTWVNTQYNDVFAFFLSGPDITGPHDAPAEFPGGAINIAILPDTDPELPITISSVNNVLNTDFYVDNPSNTDINQNGFTVTLVASAQVACGQTHHIKLAIADGSDTALESIVVLEAGSFTSSEPGIVTTIDNTGITVPEATLIEGCLDGFITVTKAQCDEATEILLEFGGTAGMVSDYEFIENPILFPEGETSIDIPIITVIDGIEEGPETIEISFEYVDFLGDTISSYTDMTIFDYNQMDLQVEDVFVCPESTTDAEANVTYGVAPYDITWSTGGSGVSETFSEGSAGAYYSVVTDFCDGLDTAFFTVFEPSPLGLDNINPYYCVGLDTDALVSGGTQPYSFIYDFASALDTLPGGGFTSDEAGIWDVTVTDVCEEEFDFELEFQVCDTQVPNVFTPTASPNDNWNNAFIIDGIEGFPGSTLKVFDRWGSLIFESLNYRNTWDGQEVPDGVYYWIFGRSDGEEYSGFVTILRKNPND